MNNFTLRLFQLMETDDCINIKRNIYERSEPGIKWNYLKDLVFFFSNHAKFWLSIDNENTSHNIWTYIPFHKAHHDSYRAHIVFSSGWCFPARLPTDDQTPTELRFITLGSVSGGINRSSDQAVGYW